MKNIQQMIKHYVLTQNKPRELELSLYFSNTLTIDLSHRWLEKVAELPRMAQQHLSAIDAILTLCYVKRLCDPRSQIILSGIHFYDPELQTYANRYVYYQKSNDISTRAMFDKQLPRFINVLYQQEYATVNIQHVHHQEYQQTLSALLEEHGIHEMPAESFCALRNTSA